MTTKKQIKKTMEVMAPAGSFPALRAAIKAQADSVYFGVGRLNMRAQSAANFSLADLKKIVTLCEKNKVKSYLTLNTLIYDKDLVAMKKICDTAKKVGVSAIIASDIATLNYAKKIGLKIHISTQQNISNLETVRFFSQYADVIVLARELTLSQIKKIIQTIKKEKIKGPSGELVKIEVFAHGALCMAIAGKCHLSLTTQNLSANRGACTQVCRRNYRLIDEVTNEELVLENNYIMSPKDLCTIGFLDKFLKAGIDILKIEGRGRNPLYVFEATRCYKEAVQALENKTYTKEKIEKWIKDLKKIFNRGFWQGGYYLGNKLGEWAGTAGSVAKEQIFEIGKVVNFFRKSLVAECKLEVGELKINDKIMFTGPTTGVYKTTIKNFLVNEKEVKKVKQGEIFTIQLDELVRRRDKIFIIKNRKNKK